MRGERGGSTLANLSTVPNADNVGEFTFFEAAWEVIMRRSRRVWNKKPKQFRHDVLAWHYLELKRKYYQLVDENDARVVRHCSKTPPFRYQVLLGAWLWSIMRIAHQMSSPELERLALRIIGDFKKLSLNPTGQHRRPAPNQPLRLTSCRPQR